MLNNRINYLEDKLSKVYEDVSDIKFKLLLSKMENNINKSIDQYAIKIIFMMGFLLMFSKLISKI